MGIKDLWSILEPFSDRKSLYELEGKIVAIDLSGWICDSQNVVEYNVQKNMFLRNLYFRSCCLLMIGVTPVFVLEGDAPSLKLATMNKRNEVQFKGCKPRNMETVRNCDNVGRRGFNMVLRTCENLLNSLGLKCVKGPGEAEAFCAFLNENGFVDGIISQDSDCFGYGALRVYRNFCVSQQNTQGGSVDIYDLRKIQQSKNIGRNHIITLALLCGCDYCPEGVGGVGKDSALKLIEAHDDDTILQRIRSWRTSEAEFTALEVKLESKSVCTQCGHKGHLRTHNKSGCSICGRTSGCFDNGYREQRLIIKNELTIRRKALINPQFPNEEIINEFLKKSEHLPNFDLSWKMPSMCNFIKIMTSVLDWNEIYCFRKFLPLLTRWQLKSYNILSQYDSSFFLKPDSIRKKRKIKGIACYDILWKDESGEYSKLIPQDQLAEYVGFYTKESLWTTIEQEHLVRNAHPHLICDFEASQGTKPKKSKTVQRKKTDPEKIAQGKISATVCMKDDPNMGIKQYFKVQKSIHKNSTSSDLKKKNEIRVNVSPKAIPKKQIKKTEDLSTFFNKLESESDSELNLSDIVHRITARPGVLAKPIILESRNIKDVINPQPDVQDDTSNHSSYFFDNDTENDEFENTFNELITVHPNSHSEKIDMLSSDINVSQNQFLEHEYVPLIERIKSRVK